MAEYVSLAIVIVSFIVFGGIGTMIGERADKSGSTRNSDVVFGVIFGFVGAVIVGVALRYLGFW